MNNINGLLPNVPMPKEIQTKVLSFCTERDLCKIATVCKSWQLLLDNDCLWKPLFIKKYGEDLANRIENSYQGSWQNNYRNFTMDLQEMLRVAKFISDLKINEKDSCRIPSQNHRHFDFDPDTQSCEIVY
jgi:hypothetical protein